MYKAISLSTALFMSASGVGADGADDGYDYYIPAEPYEGMSFEVDVACVVTVVQDFVGDFQRTNVDTGIVYAGNDDFNAFVAIAGEGTPQSSAYVSWVEVSSSNTQSHINYSQVMGPFSNAAYNEGAAIEGRYDARALVDAIRGCTVVGYS